LAANLDLIFNIYLSLVALAFALVFIGGPIVFTAEWCVGKATGPLGPNPRRSEMNRIIAIAGVCLGVWMIFGWLPSPPSGAGWMLACVSILLFFTDSDLKQSKRQRAGRGN
jgi:hypothetical protein